MTFVVTQLTRMRGGHICVAGVDVETGRHVRPVRAGNRRFDSEWLGRNGGPFELGALVDLGPVRPRPQPPQVEDVVLLGRPRRVGSLSPAAFWSMLERSARPSLTAIFGADFGRRGTQACGLPVGSGTASLGVLTPEGPVTLALSELDGRTSIRAVVPFDGGRTRVAVTDIRLYEDDCETPSEERIGRMRDMLDQGCRVLLAVGLSRAWAPEGQDASHWLQVNGVFVDDGRLWTDAEGRKIAYPARGRGPRRA